MPVLVTGGAGYIGSHMSYTLLERGLEIVVVDNLSTGLRKLVPCEAIYIEGNAGDIRLIRELINRHSIDAVIHFAGSVVVPESVANPLAYYENNSSVSRNLIQACVKEGVKDFVFSSTCAVYGMPAKNPVKEDTPVNPLSPYGRSKLVTEWVLRDASNAHPFRYVALRYFNVAGADPKGRTGQSTPDASHLIRRACLAALGKIERVDIFGTDYPTRDGSGVRDYIHVTDLVSAHLSALEYLRSGGESVTLNCGYGLGFSVREVIAAVSRIAGRPVPARPAARRPGDPPEVIADPSRLKRLFNWIPKYENLDDIVASAYRWEQTL